MSTSQPAAVMPASATSSESGLRTLVTIGIALAVVVSAFLALTQNSDVAASTRSDSAPALAVATSDLVERVVADDLATRATGGYVPGVGIIVTAELGELAVGDIDAWTRSLVADSADSVLGLGEGEEIVFLLDIAEPTRTSRLVSLDPSDLDASGTMTRREAPAISTAPLRPVFEPAPNE